MIALALIIGFMGPTHALTPSEVEASRLVKAAERRAQMPGGAVDLLRLSTLAPWCPDGVVRTALEAAAGSENSAPLTRAMAHWLLYQEAIARLDSSRSSRYAEALGLQSGFVMREGPAPDASARLTPSEWRVYPAKKTRGDVALEAFLHPNRNTTGTLATTLTYEKGGPAVLRMGFDDSLVVWLNGDEVYRSEEQHQSFLDQAAVAVHLRPGENRLMVEVGQSTGAWRFLLRVTDRVGRPLPVRSEPRAWGPVPEAVEGGLPGKIVDLWGPLYGATETEPPDPIALRDLADYARFSHMPNRDQTMIQVAVEGALEMDPHAQTLRAWTELLDEPRQRAAHAQYGVPTGGGPGDDYARLQLRLRSVWAHFYARRLSLAWSELTALLKDYPRSLRAQRLEATLYEDLGWTQTAVDRLRGVTARYPNRTGLTRAFLHSLRTAGRRAEETRILRQRLEQGRADLSERYRLAHLDRIANRLPELLEGHDEVLAGRPEHWAQTLDGIDALLDADQLEIARARFSTLETLAPRAPRLAALGVRIDQARGDRDGAIERLNAGLALYPRDETLRALKSALVTRRPRPNLGPALASLRRPSCGAAPAQVLYQHARTEVAHDGRAERWIRRVIRLCTPLGAERYGHVDIFHAPGSQTLEVLTARRVRGDREASPIYSERSLSNERSRLYFDLRAARLRFERSRADDLIEVVWRLSDLEGDPAMPGEYGEVAFLQEEIPRVHSVVEVAGPAVESVELGVIGHGLVIERSAHRVVVRDVPAVPMVDRMPGTTDAFAYVHVSTLNSWTEVESRYRRLLVDRLSPSPRLARKARALVEGAKGDREKVARLYQTVVDRVRYVGLEFGIHSFQPSPPDETWVRGYGDCKDKAVLLIAMLKAAGVEGRFVLVRTRPEGSIPTRPASLAFFDHAMVYIPTLKRFVDPTVDQNAPWTLPSPDEGASVMVMGEGGQIRVVPRRPASSHHVNITLDMTFSEQGIGRGDADWILTGGPALPTRRALEPLGTRTSRADEGLGRWIEGIRFTRSEMTGLRPAMDPVRVQGSVSLQLGRSAQGFSFPLSLGGWPGIDELAIGATRRQALVLPHLVTVDQKFSFTFPDSMKIQVPETKILESPFGVFRAKTNLNGGRLTVEIHFQLRHALISRSEYETFRSWLAEVRAARGSVVEVRYAQ